MAMIKVYRRYMIFFLIQIVFVSISNAQDISSIGFRKGIKASGGVNLSNIFYTTNDSIARRDPYQFILNGNLNLNLFGYEAPFSFSLSNTQKSYTQPFNRINFSPKYKWIKLYLGTTSMSLSPYTLSGHTFKGAGIELSPGNWRFSLMAGQLKKAIEYDPLNSEINIPSYKRMGYGFKVGYEKGTSFISANIFSASDDPNSINQLPEEGSLHPMKNIAFGFSGSTSFLENFTLKGEYSFSLLNGDIRMPVLTDESQTDESDIDPLSLQSPATRYFDAMSFGLGYQNSSFGLNLNYERISPDYQTLGGYYFNSDMENFTIAPAFRLLQGRLSLNANAGIQRNNLYKARESTSTRWVGAGTINYSPGGQWNISANYSNFSSYTKAKPLNDPFFKNELDSLNFYQITNQTGGSVNYTFGKNESPHTLILNTSFQKVNETGIDTIGKLQSKYTSINVSYSHLFSNTGLLMSVSYNINSSNAPELISSYQGPSLLFSKTMLNKTIRFGINAAWNRNLISGNKMSQVISNGININYSPPKVLEGKQNISFNLNLLNRLQDHKNAKRKREVTANLNYSYTF